MDRRSFVTSAGSGLLSILSLPALAQSFSQRMVKVVVAWPPGGFVDVAIRAMTVKLAAMWSQPVVVDNKPGAYDLIGVATENYMDASRLHRALLCAAKQD